MKKLAIITILILMMFAVNASAKCPLCGAATETKQDSIITELQGNISVTSTAADTLVNGTITAATQTITLNTAGLSSCGIQITGTWVGSLNFEGTVDGTNWIQVRAVQFGGTLVGGTTTNGLFFAQIGGLKSFRVYGTTLSSGTATIYLEATAASNAITLANSLPVGANVIGTVNDFALQVPAGNVTNITDVNKFGKAPAGVQATITDIWDRADATPTQQIWVAPTQARIHEILSTSDADSDTGGAIAQGGGARTISVCGLQTWSTAESCETVIMDGTDGTDTANSYVIIHRIRVLTSGATNINVGTITAVAAVDATVTAQVNIGEGSTEMAIYGVPSIQSFYMTQFYGSINKASGGAATITFRLKINYNPDVQLTNFVSLNIRGVQSTGVSDDEWPFNPYKRIDGPAIVKIQGIGSAADLDGTAGFDGYLVTN
jgi:hypothetical protein